MKYLLILFTLLILFSCENSSMTFPLLETKGSVKIAVRPYNVERTLSVSDTTDTVVREYFLPAGDSSIIVSQIPYGYYTFSASADTYYPFEYCTPINQQYDSYRFTLSKTPAQIEKISPTPGTINSLDPYTNPNFTDSTAIIGITFNGTVDTTNLQSKITLTPPLKWSFTSSVDYYDTKCYITIPLDIFFQTPTLQVTLDSSISFETHAPLKENYTFSYSIDTTLAKAAMHKMHIKQSYPRVNQLGFETADTCFISFCKNVDKASVESAFSITPAVSPSFWWGYENGYNTLYFTFAQGLKAKTDYTIMIDTTMRFLDGTALRSPYEIPFQTVDFYLKGTSPANGEVIDVSYYQDIVFNFSVEIDSASFMNAYSLSPEASHTDVMFTGKSIRIEYYWGLEEYTEYTVTVDSTVTDKYGTAYGREIKTTFRTTE